jgi:RNA polymerase sigma-70 factor (ECF subfamily)
MIRTLIVQFRWTLAAEEELVRAVRAYVPEACSATALKQSIIHVYARMLYDACCQINDMDRRERGYTDLFRFLYRFAYKRSPDFAEDMVNQTLLTVYEHIEDCREPGAFLSFAWWKLRAVMKKVQHQKDTLLPLTEEQEQAQVTPAEEGPEAQILLAEQLQWTLDIIQQMLNQREQHVIILTYFGSYNDREISQRLDLSLANVRVIRHRALEKLRRKMGTYDEDASM